MTGSQGSKAAPHIEASRCTGCGRCVAACRRRNLTLESSGFRKEAVFLVRERCAGCLDCVAACPVRAIRVDNPTDCNNL